MSRRACCATLGVAAVLLGLMSDLAEAASTHSPTRTRAARSANVATRIARVGALAPAAAVTAQPGVEEQAAPLPFAIDLLLPFLWNSDPGQASHGSPAVETTPELRLTWSQRLGIPVRVSALLDASSDRYAQVAAANADLLLGRLRAQYESGRDDQEWQPFLAYQPSFIFTPTWAKRVDTWNDVGGGVARYIGLDENFHRVAAGSDTRGDSAWTLGVELAGYRRFRDGGPPSWGLFTNPSVAWQISQQWSFAAEVDITLRWFDRFDDRGRRDLLVTPIVTLEYQPPERWLPTSGSGWRRAVGTPLIDLQVYLSRQNSTNEDARFRQWGAGPILRTGWKF
jgi:hypothetical protein